MLYLQLALVFLKIGLFAFGGGYATLPLIERELVINHRWLSAIEFSRLVAVAEMTPGPIGINSATFAGYVTAGFWGAALASISVCLPSFLILFCLFRMLKRLAQKEEAWVQALFVGLRPVVISLIASAVWAVGKNAFPHWSAWLIAAMSFGLVLFGEAEIIPIIITFGLVGALLY